MFSSIGGLSRNTLAAIDASSGAILDWNPSTDNWATAVATAGNTVFVGGRFNTIGGRPRTNLAALDATTGEATPWIMDANSEISSLAIVGDTLFVAGSFFSLGGQARANLAAVGTSSGAILPWNPALDGDALWLTVSDHTLYTGGGFRRADGMPASHLACIHFTSSTKGPPATVAAAVLGPVLPNPVHREGVVRFALQAAAEADLAIFDVQGRRIATLLNHEPQMPGWHDVPFRSDDWPAGFYVCRLRSGGVVASRKLLVVR